MSGRKRIAGSFAWTVSIGAALVGAAIAATSVPAGPPGAGVSRAAELGRQATELPPSGPIHLPFALFGTLPEPATFQLAFVPDRITNSVPGQRCVFLLTMDDIAGPGGPVELSASVDGATAGVEPQAITAGQVAEITVVPEAVSQEKTLTVTVEGQRGPQARSASALLDVLADMPGVDEERGAYAATVRDRFVPWLAKNRPELGITADTQWRGTVVTPRILVVMHYLFFSDEWEMHVEWHVMIPPYDWARIDLRHRFDETTPSHAFEISSWQSNTEPIEIAPPEKIWR